MGRDDAIYELCKADARIFFPGSHGGRADAVRLLLADGWSVTWNDRPNGLRTRCGFVRVTNPEDVPVEIDSPEIARGIKVGEPRDAWEILVRAPALDPVFLGGLRDRLVERGPGPNRAFVPLAAPRTFGDATVLAAAPSAMRAAEELVKEAYARAAPFGVGPCPPIFWRAMTGHDFQNDDSDRSAFSPIANAIIDGYGYGVWCGMGQEAEKAFSFSSYRTDIPYLLRWVAHDLGGATQFDTARSKPLVTKTGLSFADHDNPYESLLRIAHIGFPVCALTPERVVLVCTT